MFLVRCVQISESHCGPAVVEMLLDFNGIQKTQEEITKASGAEKTIEMLGTRVDQLALAVETLAPQAVLSYKKYATFADIETLIYECNLPVGVEWQGLFFESEEEEDAGQDYGHYSIITEIDYSKKSVIIADPYKDFAGADRVIEIYRFMNRWWDENEIPDPKTGNLKKQRDEKLLFVIHPCDQALPESLGLRTYY